MKKIRILQIALLILIQSQFVSAKDDSQNQAGSDVQQIINGSPVTTATHPWIGFLMDESEQQYCGASLIAPTFALTAAHCFLNQDGEIDLDEGLSSFVVFNSDSSFPLDADAIQASIEQIIMHPSYNPDFLTSDNPEDFDIAVVELSEAIDLEAVSLLSASSPFPAAGTLVRIMGWGTTALDEEGEPINSSDDLLEANQQIVSNADCEEIYGGGITDNMLCAGGLDAEDTTDTCAGDSGGPLVVINQNSSVQVGIVSFGGTETGPFCGDPEAPGVYANVSTLATFIAANTSGVVFTDIEGGAGGPVLTTDVSGNTVTISWTEYAGATGYILYYAPFPDQSPIESIQLGTATNIAGELPSGSAFYIAIQPVLDSGPVEVFSNVTTFSVD